MNILKIIKNKYLKLNKKYAGQNEEPEIKSTGNSSLICEECSSLDTDYHIGLAMNAYESGNLFLAYAQFKTVRFIDSEFESEKISFYIAEIEKKCVDLLDMDHNQYYRFMSMKKKLFEKIVNSNFSVLDVGGGHGQFAHFLPKESAYCLVEPSVNKISGLNIPFEDKSFDYVVSCHVLEHIDESERESFLLQLLSKAKRGVLLLNPFYCPDIPDKEQLELLVEITKADWASEHLECGLPLLEDLKNFAYKQGLNIEVEPNGTMALTTALVFSSFFASLNGEFESLRKINRMYNRDFAKILDSGDYPTAYLVYLSNTAT